MDHDQSDKILMWMIPREWTHNSRQRVLLSLIFFFSVTGFSEVGGYEGLKDKYMMAVSNDTLYSNSSCGRPREDSFVMLRDPINSDMPWAGFIFGQTIASIWYWCADQVSLVPFSQFFTWTHIYIFALYYLMIFPKIPYYSFTITLLVLKGFARPYPPPPPEVFSGLRPPPLIL